MNGGSNKTLLSCVPSAKHPPWTCPPSQKDTRPRPRQNAPVRTNYSSKRRASIFVRFQLTWRECQAPNALRIFETTRPNCCDMPPDSRMATTSEMENNHPSSIRTVLPIVPNRRLFSWAQISQTPELCEQGSLITSPDPTIQTRVRYLSRENDSVSIKASFDGRTKCSSESEEASEIALDSQGCPNTRKPEQGFQRQNRQVAVFGDTKAKLAELRLKIDELKTVTVRKDREPGGVVLWMEERN
jgi:hypothetical protein